MDKELKRKIFNLIANIIIFTFVFICMLNKHITSVSYEKDILLTIMDVTLLIVVLTISFLSQNKIDEDKVTVSKMMSTKGREEVFNKTFESDKSALLKIIDKFSCLFNFFIYLFLGIAISNYSTEFWFIGVCIATILNSVFLLNIINDSYIKNKKVYLKVVNKITDILIKISYSFFIANITIIS